ncbi:helix-turn-helix domain-containing protein [Parasphingopyxis sp.]|uniref:AraC family transcriptional regulator n=1 Tax=Parasphingopyxis sp. TaxID=1920299 RepID=UPI0026216399|nr:helix-turn-helix domain-containing protein [Parasphingopyxis sp.]
MSWDELNLVVKGGVIGLALLMTLILWRDHRHAPAGRIGMLFLVTVICHIVATNRVTGIDGPPALIDWAFEVGSNAAPGVFWLLARAWFADERPGWRSWALVAGSVGLMHWHAWMLWLDIEPWIIPTGIAGRAAAIGMAVAGLYVAWRSRGEDLIEERRRFRTWGMSAIGLYTVIVLVTEIGMRPAFLYSPSSARAWLVFGIFLLTLAAATAMLATNRADLFGAPQRSGDADEKKPELDTVLAAKLDAHMTSELAWREDGLTIAALAHRLDTQEYRLRRLINRQLGHRNFAAFLNSYRLDEVRTALADPEQRDVPILTIALDAGFGSLGPFNRAFREAEDMTPSQYRAAKID